MRVCLTDRVLHSSPLIPVFKCSRLDFPDQAVGSTEPRWCQARSTTWILSSSFQESLLEIFFFLTLTEYVSFLHFNQISRNLRQQMTKQPKLKIFFSSYMEQWLRMPYGRMPAKNSFRMHS